MTIISRKWLACAVLALGLCLMAKTSTYSADDDDKKAAAAAQKAILELAEGKGNAAALAKQHTLDHVMRSFKLKTKGGIDVGVMPGIEAKVIALSKKEMAKGDLSKESASLTKMSDVIKAIGDISGNYKQKKDQKDWDKYMKDMIDQSAELKKAVKGMDTKAVKGAAGKMNQACNECHGKFRDN